jgi:RNA-binding protein 15
LIGNLELNITDEEMKRIFGRYGELVDIDIKRPPPGTGNAYAFIRDVADIEMCV